MATAICSAGALRDQRNTPRIPSSTARPGTKMNTNAVTMTHAIAIAIPSWPANATTATRPAASSAPMSSNPVSSAIANTGSAAQSEKNAPRSG